MQCQKFNDRWTFEKVDQDDRLKAFYGDDNKIIVTLPYDAMSGRCTEWLLSWGSLYL